MGCQGVAAAAGWAATSVTPAWKGLTPWRRQREGASGSYVIAI
jgi:hypothetical protein